MKSFSQFWEEATLSDLERQHAQSAEGKRQERLRSRQRAESEAARRREAAKQLTKKHRAKMLAKRRSAEARNAQQSQDAEDRKVNQIAREAQARQRARQTTRNVSQAARGTYELGKMAAQRIGKTIRNRRNRTQSNQTP